MGGSFQLEDYVDVATRIAIFREKFPNGSLQSEILQYGPEVIVVKAYAFRTPDDARPGVGHASEVLPGKTPYTRDSELMVAETSAWGRAIVAALAADTKKGVASKDEVVRATETRGNGKAKRATNGHPTTSVTLAAVPELPDMAPVDGETPIVDPLTGEANKATAREWARLVQRYGSKAAVVKAARERFGDTVHGDEDITHLRAGILLQEVAK